MGLVRVRIRFRVGYITAAEASSMASRGISGHGGTGHVGRGLGGEQHGERE